jgi:hypothetical protein
MHVAAAPRTASIVVFFEVDASRATTCITPQVRALCPPPHSTALPCFRKKRGCKSA